MADVSIRQIYKQYGSVEVIHGLDLEIADGEFVVLVGPSGCGKSTMLRMVAGLEEITGGEIAIGGRVVNNVEPKDRNIAMVFQNYAIYPHMTVYKNIGFGLRTARLAPADKDRRIRDTAKILGLTDLLERRPSQLSGGQRQRVAMGRAMVRQPAVFLFDEPLSNLDAQLRAQMRLEIKKLHQAMGTTIVFVTHDQVEAMTLADRIVIMKDGYIQQMGTPTEVYEHPATMFAARFIGSPSMNMLPATGAADASVTLATGARVPAPASVNGSLHANQALFLGVRPDHLLVSEPGAPGALQLDGTVSVVEPLGPEALVYVTIGDSELVAKAPARSTPDVGATVHLTAAGEAVHLFDAQTERALC